MPSPAIAVARAKYEAIARNDRDAWLACFAADGALIEPGSLPYGGPYRGHSELLRLGVTLRETWDGLRFSESRFHDAGSTVLVESRVTGRSRRTGRAFDALIAEVLTFQHGLIELSRIYLDTTPLIEALDESSVA